MANNAGGLHGELTLDATQAQQALESIVALTKAVQMRLGELAKAGGQTDLGGGYRQSKKAVEQDALAIDDNTKARRAWFQEQRLQDRTWRESIGTLTSLTFAVGYLTQGNKENSESTKRVTDSLMTMFASTQAVEFALFSVARAGKTVKGTIGDVLLMFGKFSGPIAIAVGAVAGLMSYLNSASAKTREWQTSAMDSMMKGLVDASGGRLDLITEARDKLLAQQKGFEQLASMNASTTNFADRKAAIEALRPAPFEKTDNIVGDFGKPTPTASDAAEVSNQANKGLVEQIKLRTDVGVKMKETLDQMEAQVNIERMGNDILKETGSQFQKNNIYIKEMTADLQTRKDLAPDQRTAMLDNIRSKQVENEKLMQSSLDIAMQQSAQTAFEVDMHHKTNQELIAQLERQMNLVDANKETLLSAKDRLELEKNIATVKQAERDKGFKDAQDERSLRMVGIESELAARQSAEDERYVQEKKNIQDAHADRKNNNRLDAEGERLFTLNEAAHVRANADIKRKLAEDIRALNLVGIDSEYAKAMAAETERFDQEQRNIRESNLGMKERFRLQEANDAAHGRALENARLIAEQSRRETNLVGITTGSVADIAAEDARFAKRKREIQEEGQSREMTDQLNFENELAHDRQRTSIYLDQVTQIGSTLESYFSKAGDTLTAKLMQALQLGIQLAKAIASASAEGADGVSGGLGIVGSLLGFLSLNTATPGGNVGSTGTTGQQSNAAYGGVPIGPALVNALRGNINGVTAALRTGFDTRMYAPILRATQPSPAAMLQRLTISGSVDLSNGQLFLRREWPELDRFNKKKQVG